MGFFSRDKEEVKKILSLTPTHTLLFLSNLYANLIYDINFKFKLWIRELDAALIKREVSNDWPFNALSRQSTDKTLRKTQLW